MALRAFVALFLALFLLSQTAAKESQRSQNQTRTAHDNSPSCNCYLISGPDPGWFRGHRFWDFRNIATSTDTPPLIIDTQGLGLEPVTSDYFQTEEWGNDWQIQKWSSNITSAGPVRRVNSAQNIWIASNEEENGTTCLAMRAIRTKDFMSTAEIDGMERNLLHASIRVMARVMPNQASNGSMGEEISHPVDDGAVVGFFTYGSPNAESDIEILTSDPVSSVRWSNQPTYNYSTDAVTQGASTDFSLPTGVVWTDWVEHRLDWFEGRSSWLINGELLLNKTYGVPMVPSWLNINVWGNGGQWSGNMAVGGSVVVGIEYIELVYNVSTESQTGGRVHKDDRCEVACVVDSVGSVGWPEVAWTSTSTAARLDAVQRGNFYLLMSAFSVLLGVISSF